MTLPMIEDTTETPGWDASELFLMSDDQWASVEEPAIGAMLTEILGYDPELIRTGTTTPPAADARETYRDLMERILGYVLEEIPEISRSVQEALNEIASGDTTVVLSTEELEEHLRGLDPNG